MSETLFSILLKRKTHVLKVYLIVWTLSQIHCHNNETRQQVRLTEFPLSVAFLKPELVYAIQGCCPNVEALNMYSRMDRLTFDSIFVAFQQVRTLRVAVHKYLPTTILHPRLRETTANLISALPQLTFLKVWHDIVLPNDRVKQILLRSQSLKMISWNDQDHLVKSTTTVQEWNEMSKIKFFEKPESYQLVEIVEIV
jgi:hypothetical protein